ncbi:MAG: hypothetical protein ABIZ04_19145 [Opitutus sp.]
MSLFRALAPLIAEAGKIAVTARSSTAAKIEDRMLKLEQATIRTGEVLTGVAEQLQVVAEELRVEAEGPEALRQRARTTLIVAIVALCVGVGAILFAALR